MTSTAIVKSEISRFLRSKNSEVLCISGSWGVGKTYTWKLLLEEAAERAALSTRKYSYASLFGINSLVELKLAIAENMQILEADAASVRGWSLTKSKNIALGSVKHLKNFTSAIPYVGKAISESGNLYFSILTSDQLICMDDLDRRGSALRIQDVLGLVSFLKEERNCKIVLLLNEEELGEDKQLFDRYFEKVIDRRLVFSPTPSEAISIAIKGADPLSKAISGYCEKLGISNIRVIKKIEGIVREIHAVVEDRSEMVKSQTVHSVVLFAWTKFQPDLAPSFDVYSSEPLASYISDNEAGSDESGWTTVLEDYGFGYLDEYDCVLMESVKEGFADEAAIRAKALQQDDAKARAHARSEIESCFRPLHDTFMDNLDEVTSTIADAFLRHHQYVSVIQLDDVVSLFKSLDRPDAAQRLLNFFEQHEVSVEFWNPVGDVPMRRPISDPDVISISQRVLTSAVTKFDAASKLLEAASTLDAATLHEVAERVGSDEIYALIKERSGVEMRAIIDAGLGYRRIGNATPDMQKITKSTLGALKRIRGESKLNALRVKKYHVWDDGNEPAPEVTIESLEL
jgi:uncharacterized protein (DUF2147 family)